MIKIENLTFSFSEYKVLKNICIDFEENLIHGIVGLNGAGKTTFFNILSTYLRIQEGSIRVDNHPVALSDIGYLETVNFFYSRLTGNEYLKIFKQTNSAFDLAAMQDFLKLPLDELIETYSTGMKKKLALLGVLKQDKKIYLFDEPFNGLDLETNKIVELIITTLKSKGKTVFISSHIIDPLLAICDKVHYLNNGEFARTFHKEDFHKIEDELFTKLKSEAAAIIIKSI